MDETTFARVEPAFRAFHRIFAPLFGRWQAEDRSAQYLRGLLVQQTDRRNAENLAEAVPGATPRALQRFLTDSPWDHARVITRLQDYVGDRLNADDGVFVLDDTGFAKQGKHSVGVARQYSGTLGKVGNCQIGVFLTYVSARGHALVDMRLYLPREWTEDPARGRAAGVPKTVGYQSKAELGLALLRAAQARGALQSRWVTADEAYGEVPTLRDTLEAERWWYVLEVPRTTRVFLEHAKTEVPPWSGRGGRPTRSRLVAGAPPPQAVGAIAAGLTKADWTVLTVAEGSQGPRRYQFAVRRGWESRAGLPGRETWIVFRRNLDGTELKFYLSNAPATTALLTLGQVGAQRWPIETDFQMEKGETGLDEYEVRSWDGWHHHITLALLAGGFLLTVRQEWGEKDARSDGAASEPGAAGTAAPTGLDAGRALVLAGGDATAQRACKAITRQPARQVA